MLTNDNYSPAMFLFAKNRLDISELYSGQDTVD